MRYSFSKHQRVLRGVDFTRILKKGRFVADGTLVMFAIESVEFSKPRLGITIPKKTGNAVARNRWKRLIRESFRTQQDQMPTGFDYVIRPKKGAALNWSRIRKSVPKLAKKATRSKDA